MDHTVVSKLWSPSGLFVRQNSCSSTPCFGFRNNGSYSRRKFSIRWNIRRSWKPLYLPSQWVIATSANDASLSPNVANNDCGDFWRDSEFVEVIAIGSRKDAALNFFLNDSQFLSSSLRFWNILIKDSSKLHLQQKTLGKDMTPRIFEASLSSKSSPKTIILVASAGYGLDHIAAIEILKTIRSANGFAVVVILNPFSFEGLRRQDEVKDLKGKLQEHSNLLIDVDTDMILTKDLVTLDEAVRTANNVVLLAMTAVSVLTSDKNRRLIDVLDSDLKDVKASEVLNILESYKEAKVRIGTGHSLQTSILRAVCDCPLLTAGVKDMNGIIICIVASSSTIDDNDLHGLLCNFRQSTQYKGQIIISTRNEPSLESKYIATIFFIGRFSQQLGNGKGSILSRLAQHFPFILRLLGRDSCQTSVAQRNDFHGNPYPSEVMGSRESGMMINKIAEDSDIEQLLNNNYYEVNDSRETVKCGAGLSEASTESSNFYDPNDEESSTFQREPLVSWSWEPLVSWSWEPGYHTAEKWSNDGATESEVTSVLDKLSIFHLPVGIRRPEELTDNNNISSSKQKLDQNPEDDLKAQQSLNISPYRIEWCGRGLEAVRDICNTAPVLLKGKNTGPAKRPGQLALRAATMLEAERDSPKQWSPNVEIKFRGGIYRGRCLGGLPEGKGRLVLEDGSIYDGMWHFGKRSGPGTFYFVNGDIFQGSWRDDIMHGKGWLYFHTGDRWFANFWKGKANGESRFYSKCGDVFFGHFQDGWRHGDFLYIDVDGTRYIEEWNKGILESRRQVVF